MNFAKEIDVKNCFLAGGALLSAATKKEIADYDIYPKNREGFEDVVLWLIENNCFVVNISDRAITFKSNDLKMDDGLRSIIQVMTYDYFPTAEHIFENFDFTVCMAAYDYDTDTCVFHDDFYPDIASKTLRFNVKTKYPLNSMLRVTKYREKGYYIAKTEMTKIALTVAQKGLPDSWEELENEIGGTYGREMQLVRGDTPYSYDAAINLLSDMVFDFDKYEVETKELAAMAKITADDIVDFMTKENKSYFTTGIEKGVFSSTTKTDRNFFLENGGIGSHMNDTLITKMGIPDNFTKVTSGTVYAYVQLEKTDENNVFNLKIPGANYYNKKDVKISVRSEVEDNIKVFSTAFSAKSLFDKKMVVGRVSFDMSDVVNYSGTQFTVKKVFLENIQDF